MGRDPKVFWDSGRKGWTTSALGEVRTSKSGQVYRTKVTNRELGSGQRKEAQAWLAAELARQEAAAAAAGVRVQDPGNPSFELVSEWYLQDGKGTRRLGAEAQARTAEHLRRFADYPGPRDPNRMGLLPIGRVAPDHLRAFVADLVAQGRSESYVMDGLVKSIRACCRWASRVRGGAYAGLPIAANPLAAYEPPPKPRRSHRAVNPAQIDAFFAWYWRRLRNFHGASRRFRRIAGILLLALRETGARPKELCTATWDEWSLRPDGFGIITLPWRRWKNGKKTRQARLIVVKPRVARRIEWIRRQEGRHPTAIFTHRQGRTAGRPQGAAINRAGEPFVADYETGTTRELQNWFYRVRQQAIAAGVPIPPEFRLYWFRSLFSTESQRLGKNKAFLAKGMGTSEKMLELHYTDEEVEDVMSVYRDKA